MAEKLTIQFSAQGGEALKKTINDLHLSNVQLTKGQAAFVKAQKQVENQSKKVKKITSEQSDAIKLNKLEFDKLSRTLDLSTQSLKRLGLTTKTVIRASKGNAKALAVVKRAYNMEKQAVLEVLAVAKAKAAQDKKIDKGLKKVAAAQKKVQIANKKTAASLLKLNHSARNTSGAFSTLRSQMLLASFAMLIVVKPLKDIMSVFSDMEETMSKANVVFGENIDLVKRWAEGLGNSVGRASSTLIGMASTLQDTFVPLGFTREAATKLSTSLTELALDVASFNNQSDDEVLKAFQSAIVGNHETVRKFGIVITESSLKQEAYNLGITETIRELSSAEKVQARLSLIQKGSKDAVGDLIRTQDSYINQVKELQSMLKEAMESVGKAMLPVAKMVVILLKHMAKTSTIKGYGVAIGAVGTYLLYAKIQALGFTLALNKVKVAMAKTGIGLAVVIIGELATNLWFANEAIDDLADGTDEYQDELDALNIELNKTADINEKLLQQQLKGEQKLEEEIALIKAKTAALYSNSDAEVILLQAATGRLNLVDDLSVSEKRLITIRTSLQSQLDSEARKIQRLDSLYSKFFGTTKTRRDDDLKQQIKDSAAALSKLDIDKDSLVIMTKNVATVKNLTTANSDLNDEITAQTNIINTNDTSLKDYEDELAEIKSQVSGVTLALGGNVTQGGHNVVMDNLLATTAQFLGIALDEVTNSTKQSTFYTAQELAAKKARIETINKEIKKLNDSNIAARSLIETKEDDVEANDKTIASIDDTQESIDDLTELIRLAEIEYNKLEAAAKAAADELKKGLKELNLKMIISGIEGAFDQIDLGLDWELTLGLDNLVDTWGTIYDVTLQGATDTASIQAASAEAMKTMSIEATAMIIDQAIAQAQAHYNAQMDIARDAANAQKKINADIAKQEMDLLKNRRSWNRMSKKEQEKAEKEILDVQKAADAEADKELAKSLKKSFEKKQDLARIGVIMDTAGAIMKIWKDYGFPAGTAPAILMGVMGALQLAVINSQKPPKAALGGLIGGNRHSQGGTMIEAEEGEFIMNRSAVDSVGIETMNRINSSGGGGAINISFAGNVLSKDFIEDEAVPQIKEALRRGGDLGVS